MERPRVLIVLSYFHPYVSGVSEYARMLAEGLARACEVTVLTGRHDPALPEREQTNGYTIERAAVLARLHKGYLSGELVRRYQRLAANADVVNLHLPMLDAAWLACMTPGGKPLIATYHCDIQAVGGPVDRLAVAAVNFASRRLLRRAQRVVVTSLDYARGSGVLAPFADKLVEGYAPIKFVAPREPAQSRRDPAEFRVGFLGRFVKEKGLDVLLKAALLALPSVPDLKLILAGEYRNVAGGSVYASLQPLIDRLGEHVELPGSLDEAGLPAFYRSLDVLVLPSVNAYEAFGMVQVEAMLCGTPVIASDMRGVRVPVQLTGNGVLVPPGDPAALAVQIRALAGRPRLDRAEVIARAQARFSTQDFLQRYRAVIGTLVSRQPA